MKPILHQRPGATIAQFACLSDNYGWLIHDDTTGKTACIDTPDADAVNAALTEMGWKLDFILNTHWHADHTGGNVALKKQWQCRIIGPVGEAQRIPGIDHTVSEGDEIGVGALHATIIDTPGHTSGHCAYYFAPQNCAFVGDTVFSLGCGRLFEGTAAQMWHSISKLRALPDDTLLCCAHEYTAANARYAITIEPDNSDLQNRLAEIKTLRAQNLPTVPTSLSLEKKTNPFLRADRTALIASMNMQGQSPEKVFAAIRSGKDNFKG